MRLTNKLLSFLHRVFDKDPGQFLALRLRYTGGMKWTVADGVLTTAIGDGPGSPLTIDLSQFTVSGLINHLAAQPGYTIEYGDQSDLALLSALVLLDGSGDIEASNGDHLHGYTSLLHAYYEPVASELAQAQVQIGEALKQMSTKTASNEWLDELGGYYDVPRLLGEIDATYGPRIIAEVLRPRGNNIAIEEAIRVYTGEQAKVTDVTLYGPTFPLYNQEITHNGEFLHNASAKPIYGLFDVEYGYDIINGGDISEFVQIVRDLIGRLRDAGTHLRSLQLKGSTLSDDYTSPPTDDAAIAWGINASLEDDLTAPSETLALDSSFAELSDDLARPIDGLGLSLLENYRHNSIRRYDAKITHVGYFASAENTGIDEETPPGAILRLDGSWALNGQYGLTGYKPEIYSALDVLLRANGSYIANASEIADGIQ